MNTDNKITTQLFALLLGEWQGHGKGEFPTIDSFEYRERLRFEHRDALTIFYDQRTDQRVPMTDQYETSHWESGFIRVLETGQLEMTNAQSGGRSEVLIGDVTMIDNAYQLQLASTHQTNDGRMIHTTRQFSVTPEQLTYKMGMHTTSVDRVIHHLEATLTKREQAGK